MSSLRTSLVFAAALQAACSTAMPTPTTADAERGKSRYPDLQLAQLQQGRELYLRRCGSCHVLKEPSEVRAEEWPGEVQKMRQENGVKLSDAEAEAISRYLVTLSEAPAPAP